MGSMGPEWPSEKARTTEPFNQFGWINTLTIVWWPCVKPGQRRDPGGVSVHLTCSLSRLLQGRAGTRQKFLFRKRSHQLSIFLLFVDFANNTKITPPLYADNPMQTIPWAYKASVCSIQTVPAGNSQEEHNLCGQSNKESRSWKVTPPKHDVEALTRGKVKCQRWKEECSTQGNLPDIACQWTRKRGNRQQPVQLRAWSSLTSTREPKHCSARVTCWVGKDEPD